MHSCEVYCFIKNSHCEGFDTRVVPVAISTDLKGSNIQPGQSVD